MAKVAIQAYVSVLIEDSDPIPKESDSAGMKIARVDLDIGLQSERRRES